MRAEILTIGDEILIGQIVNTNSVWMAQKLNESGIKVVHMASVSDDEQAIVKAFDDAATRADFVFITGGLGPTKDDITKKTFAAYFDAPLVEDAQVLADVQGFFAARGRDLGTLNRLQAMVPKGCTVIRNSVGTAPGMWMNKGKTVYISMPGVPYEMKEMMANTILPKIKAENTLPFIYHKTVLTNGIAESSLAELISDWEDRLVERNIKLAYLPQPGMVRLRLSTSGNELVHLKQQVDEAIAGVVPLIEKFIFGYEAYGQESPGLEKIVSDLLRARNATLSIAESCTGGYVSALFTSLAGASEIFKGSVVPYANNIKNSLLEVDNGLFDTVGVVSKPCVEQLAGNVLKKFDSDYAIAISGIAGPGGGTPDKPVGTVWVAVATRTDVRALKFQFGDHRQRNIVMTANAAMNMLRKVILKSADLHA
jgi:nicotinamide-nucleotide amidase